MIAILGGTHILRMPGLERQKERGVRTAHGRATARIGRLGGVPVALLQRHGRGRNLPPHRVPHAANLAALKKLGAACAIGMGSAGCLHPEIPIPSILVPHDYISFFDPTVHDDRLVHVTPGFDEEVRNALIEEARASARLPVRERGVYFQSRGPRLETRAEIAWIRTVADCVGMTIASEATIAREIGLPYAAVCTLDNYAHGIGNAPLDYRAIRENAERNAGAVLDLVSRAVRRLAR